MLRGEAAEAGAEGETDAVVEPLRFGLWGSFSADGADQELADHAAQLAAGALGLAAGEALPTQGVVFLSPHDRDKSALVPVARRLAELGFSLIATSGTAAALAADGLEVQSIL